MRHVPAPALALAAALAIPGVVAPPGLAAQDAVASALLSQFERVSGYVLTAAEQVPEDRYSYRPTEEVYDLAGFLNHLADTHFSYCSAAGGRDAPAGARDQPGAKADIVERVRASREFCLGVYRQATDASLAEAVDDGDRSRAAVLIQNVSHDNLHYGNIVTYMREIGMVPPSSQGSG